MHWLSFLLLLLPSTLLLTTPRTTATIVHANSFDMGPSAEVPTEWQGNHRRHKRDFGVVSIWVLAQLVSVVTGSLANDFTASSLWMKIIYCFKILRHHHFLRGYKHCWNYANRSNEKWRKLLKPHNMEGIIRIMAARLKQHSEVHFKEALITIQQDFEQLTLTGDQFVRVVNLLQNAGLNLYSIANQNGAPTKELRARWKKIRGPEIDVLVAHLEILRLLKHDYSAIFAPDKPHEQLPLRSSIVDMYREGEGQKLELDLRGMELELWDNVSEWTRKFLKKLVDEMVRTEMGQKERARKLMVHAHLVMNLGALEQWYFKEKLEGEKADKLEQYNSLGQCLLEVLCEKGYEGPRRTFGEARKWAKANVAKMVPKLDMDKDELAKFIGKIRKMYLPIWKERKRDKCVDLERMLEMMDWDIEGNELNWKDEKLKEFNAKEKRILEMIVDEIGKEHFGDHSGTKKSEAGGAGTVPLPEWRDPEVLAVHAKMAALGHIISRNLVTHRQKLDQIALILDEPKLVLDPGLFHSFHTLCFAFLDRAQRLNSEINKLPPQIVEEMEKMIGVIRHKPIEEAESVGEAMEGLGMDGIVLVETGLDRRVLDKLMEQAKKVATAQTFEKKQKAAQDQLNTDASDEGKGGKLFQRSRSLFLPTQRRAMSNKERKKRRRRKRFTVGDFMLGLGTGFLGNWVSDWIDISRTLRDCVWNIFHLKGCRLVWSSEVRRKQREKAIMDFQGKTYHTLFMKLAEMKEGAAHLEGLVKEVEEFLRKAVRSEGTDTKGLSLDTFLFDLDLFSFRDIRYHINEHLQGSANSSSKLNILKAMQELDFISEQRRDKERSRILAEMTAEEREQYWEELDQSGIVSPTGPLSMYLQKEFNAKFGKLKNANSEVHKRVAEVRMHRKELAEYKKEWHKTLKLIRGMEGAEESEQYQEDQAAEEAKVAELRRQIRENEAEIERKMRKNEKMRGMVEQYERMAKVRKEMAETERKLEQVEEAEGEAKDVEHLTKKQRTELARFARLQLLIHEMEAITLELGDKFKSPAAGAKAPCIPFAQFKLTFLRYSKLFGLIRDLDLGKSIGLEMEQLQRLQSPANLVEGIQSVLERGKALLAGNRERHREIQGEKEFKQVLENRLGKVLWEYEQKWKMVKGWPRGEELRRMGEEAEEEAKCEVEGMMMRMISREEDEEEDEDNERGGEGRDEDGGGGGGGRTKGKQCKKKNTKGHPGTPGEGENKGGRKGHTVHWNIT